MFSSASFFFPLAQQRLSRHATYIMLLLCFMNESGERHMMSPSDAFIFLRSYFSSRYDVVPRYRLCRACLEHYHFFHVFAALRLLFVYCYFARCLSLFIFMSPRRLPSRAALCRRRADVAVHDATPLFRSSSPDVLRHMDYEIVAAFRATLPARCSVTFSVAPFIAR